ncbi:MAG: DUF4388 domain-containing protein, partial [Myxococcota bacterium]
DSSTVLRVVEGVLTQNGYETFCTDDGALAADLAREVTPDIIFVDFAMPGVNGFEVCRRLGQHPELESIPIVIMSTRGDPIGERFVREMGIIDHITKPFAPEALLALVEHTLHRARFPRRVRHGEAQTPPSSQSLAMHFARALGDGEDDISVAQALNDPEWLQEARELLMRTPGAPALVGDIGQVGLSEVLQMFGLQRQTGRFRVRGRAMEIEAWFGEGAVRLVTGRGIPEEHMLGAILVRRGELSKEHRESLLTSPKTGAGRFGAEAVRAGYVSAEALESAMRFQSTELVYETLRFGTGSFEFVRHPTLPDWVIEFNFELTIDELLMEGFRRVDEWGLIEDAIPSFECVPVQRDAATDRLTADELHVLQSIDGESTVRAVLDRASLGTFEGARILYRLVSLRVVTLITHPPTQNLVG